MFPSQVPVVPPYFSRQGCSLQVAGCVIQDHVAQSRRLVPHNRRFLSRCTLCLPLLPRGCARSANSVCTRYGCLYSVLMSGQIGLTFYEILLPADTVNTGGRDSACPNPVNAGGHLVRPRENCSVIMVNNVSSYAWMTHLVRLGRTLIVWYVPCTPGEHEITSDSAPVVAGRHLSPPHARTATEGASRSVRIRVRLLNNTCLATLHLSFSRRTIWYVSLSAPCISTLILFSPQHVVRRQPRHMTRPHIGRRMRIRIRDHLCPWICLCTVHT